MIWWALFIGLALTYCFHRVDKHLNMLNSKVADLEHAVGQLNRELAAANQGLEEMQAAGRALKQEVWALAPRHPAEIGDTS